MEQRSRHSPTRKSLSQKESSRKNILDDSGDEDEASYSSHTRKRMKRNIVRDSEDEGATGRGRKCRIIEDDDDDDTDKTEDEDGDESDDATSAPRSLPLPFVFKSSWGRRPVGGKQRCVCKRDDGGERVRCSNDDCLHEWFHRNCVGLKNKIVALWACPACMELGVLTYSIQHLPKGNKAEVCAKRSWG